MGNQMFDFTQLFYQSMIWIVFAGVGFLLRIGFGCWLGLVPRLLFSRSENDEDGVVKEQDARRQQESDAPSSQRLLNYLSFGQRGYDERGQPAVDGCNSVDNTVE